MLWLVAAADGRLLLLEPTSLQTRAVWRLSPPNQSHDQSLGHSPPLGPVNLEAISISPAGGEGRGALVCAGFADGSVACCSLREVLGAAVCRGVGL